MDFRIAATMQEQFDRFVLLKAGLIQPGETPLAYFELVDRKSVDPQKEVEWAVQLKQAGFDRDLAELEERTGMKLTKAEPTQPPAYNAPLDSGLGRSPTVTPGLTRPSPPPTAGPPNCRMKHFLNGCWK